MTVVSSDVCPATGDAPVLHVDGIVKQFEGTRALDDVSLTLHRNEVHALVGHNGSGKSTLVKILAGYHRPDRGSVAVNGQRVSYPTNAVAMQRRGVYFMHQDIGLAPRMSVLENLRIISFETGLGRHIRWRAERERAANLLERFTVDIDPGQLVESLSPTERAIVGVVRAFQQAAQHATNCVVVLDEPTAFLPRMEVERLFEVVRKVADAGCAVLLVTHHIDEPFAIADNVTVLRGGRVSGNAPVSSLTPAELIQLIVGDEIDATEYDSVISEEILRVDGLCGGKLHDASFVGNSGEIIGLTGLNGAGHEDVPYLLCGARRSHGGTVVLKGERLRAPTPADSIRRGMAFLPADRQRHSGIPKATVCENMTLSHLSAYRKRFGGLDRDKERTAVRALIDTFNVLPRRPDAPLTQLSGGNQQKALLARWFAVDPVVLLLHEPTQGVDIASCQEIFTLVQKHAAKGRLVIIASNQYEDLARVCTRVLVFRNGWIASEVCRAELTADRLMAESYAL